MHPSIPPGTQQKAEEYTREYPHCHIGIIRIPSQWIVAGRPTRKELQQLFDTYRYANGFEVTVMWSHPPMVQ